MRTTAPAIRLALLSALAFVASPAYAEVDPFPTAAATLTGVSFGATSISFFFDTGDQISEVVTTDDALVSRAIFDLVIPANNSQVQIDFDVFVNDIPIGTLSVPAMQTGPIHQEYDFDPISGPDYTVRLTETTQVPGGQGSLTIGYAAADAGTLELVPTPARYACRQVKDRSDPKFAKVLDLSVVDPYATETVDVQKPFEFCAAAEVDGVGVSDPSSGLCCYKIKAAKLKPPVSEAATDEFGTHQLDVGTAKTLCLPCTLAP